VPSSARHRIEVAHHLQRRLDDAAAQQHLPVQDIASSRDRQQPQRQQAGQHLQSLWRVLVVDDEAELAELMRDMLESGGYEVATAESGAVALELLDTARFDAIVSDLRMPDMDGAALWREILVRHPALSRRVLFVTGDTLSRDAREFSGAPGATRWTSRSRRTTCWRRWPSCWAEPGAMISRERLLRAPRWPTD